ncbi:membrane alanyl aminopeptidase-like [Teleopsis dalmanni]|uniref:membrane alanyl aminopeptidase-like n=1 Tax=Teleopsis dalmanni TaxID=139649 RepID=UPI0018CDFD8A|nr:membrane alanyl aminopeptidase-like [Teleopsis dalmanni]
MRTRTILHIALLLLIICICHRLAQAQINYRLSNDIIPEAYNITIKPYLLVEDEENLFKYEGEIQIKLHAIVSEVREITLHKGIGVILTAAAFYDSTNKKIYLNIESFVFDQVTDKLTIRLDNALTVNAAVTLHFEFNGKIRTNLTGLYRTKYIDENENLKWIAATQMYTINARTVFPCFDEPALKAKFRMQISRPKEFNSVFNTRLIKTEVDGENRYMDYFEETPLMSTYLVAFIVSDFVTTGNTDFSIITRSAYKNYTGFSFEVGLKAVAAYDNFTQLPYKDLGNTILQNAGSPDLPYNAMENWGLVIYKESVLVNEPGYTDGWANKQYTLTVLVHEIAHMWFGNSVTFAWWSYFWLNEGFARYYQYFMAHELYPEYQLDQQFVINQMHFIFGIDAVNTTQPLTIPEGSVQSPSEIENTFSIIAYAKGASIIRMIRNLMGSDNFDNAIRQYLKENHLKNVRPQDLFTRLKAHWPTDQVLNLDNFFYDWTEKVGYPYVFVRLDNNGSDVYIEQHRFLFDPIEGSNPNLYYTIPITFTTDKQKNFNDLKPKFYMDNSGISASRSLEDNAEWIIFNLQQSNYYRVLYEEKILINIRKALLQKNHSDIPVINRAQLVDDLFNFARNGSVSYDRVIQFMEYLAFETEYLPWYAAFSGFEHVAKRLPLKRQKDFGDFLKEITEAVYKKLGFVNKDNTILDVYNRNKVINWVCKYGIEDCNKIAQAQFDNVINTNVKPSADFRETLYCSAVRSSSYRYYETLFNWFTAENVTTEKELLARSQGCTRLHYKAHFERIMKRAIPGDYRVMTLKSLYGENPENVEPVFDLMLYDIEELSKTLGGWPVVADVISDIADYFTTIEQQRKLETFVKNKGELFGTSKVTLDRAVNKVASNLLWTENNFGVLYTYFDERDNAGINQQISMLVICLSVLLNFFR